MTRAERIHKSKAARVRRKKVKDIIIERTFSFYDKMRRLRKKQK
jgi:hypothetical protein